MLPRNRHSFEDAVVATPESRSLVFSKVGILRMDVKVYINRASSDSLYSLDYRRDAQILYRCLDDDVAYFMPYENLYSYLWVLLLPVG